MVLPAPVGAPGESVADESTFEQRDIDYIPVAERRGKPVDLFWMWAGALFNVEYVVYGALIISFGLSLRQAALVILIGNLSYLVAGIGSLQGLAAGTSVFAITGRRSVPTGPAACRSSTGSPTSARRPRDWPSSCSRAWRFRPRPAWAPRPA